MFILLFSVLIFALIIPIGMYNGLVATRNRVDNAWSQIDVQLKKRHDLVPKIGRAHV